MFGNFGSLYRCAAAHNITREMEEEEERKKKHIERGRRRDRGRAKKVKQKLIERQ